MSSLEGKEYGREIVVGLFFISALVLLAVFTIVIKREAFMGEHYERQIEFERINTIKAGDRVSLRGVEVGRVTKLEPLLEQQKVLMTVSLSTKLQFREGYLIELRATSALGGQEVYVELGEASAPVVADDSVLIGKTPADLLSETAKLSQKVGAAVEDIQRITQEIINGPGTVHKLIYEDTAHTEATKAFSTVQSAGEKLGEAMGSIKESSEKFGSAMDELKNLSERVDTALGDFEELRTRLESAADRVAEAGTSLTGAGDSVKELSDGILVSVREAQEGKGTIGKLMTDESLYNEAQAAVTEARAAVEDLKVMLERFKKEDSSLTRLVQDDGELYTAMKSSFENLSTAFDKVNRMADEVSQGQGTLGKLLKDESLYNETRKTVEEVRGAVSDFREQAPILTFGSFIFGAL